MNTIILIVCRSVKDRKFALYSGNHFVVGIKIIVSNLLLLVIGAVTEDCRHIVLRPANQ